MKEIIEKAREWALKEIKENGSPSIEHFNLSNDKGQEIAEKLDADKDIVMLGTILMDIKLGLCLKDGRVKEHVKESVIATEKFLEDFNLDKEIKDKIINCVAAHHGTIPYICKEAEICANADCYRFISPTGVFVYFGILANRYENISDRIKQAQIKMEEKWNVLSLDICKKELESYYKAFKVLF